MVMKFPYPVMVEGKEFIVWARKMVVVPSYAKDLVFVHLYDERPSLVGGKPSEHYIGLLSVRLDKPRQKITVSMFDHVYGVI